jgi:hypothetical protein
MMAYLIIFCTFVYYHICKSVYASINFNPADFSMARIY